jgi:D-beta-D-heptose 7-phosphate kinase/D-beta-D-heptose 1-phosphate adenosyltransferase
MPVSNDEEIVLAARHLLHKCNCTYVLATCGARAMALVSDQEAYFVESTCHEVFDVTGAGDTTIAYLSACIANGFDMKDAVDIANSAAGVQVSKVGTSCVYWSEVRRYLSEMTDETKHRLLERNALRTLRENYADKKIVFTNGCFDLLHIGHVRYLQEAAKLGDLLVVGLNSDASVKRLKGETRPVNSEADRAELLCALGFVDYVVIFEEDTPYEIIDLVQPDVLVKGGDYSNSYVVGTDIVEARGGKLVLIPFVEGKSTTSIIEKMKH